MTRVHKIKKHVKVPTRKDLHLVHVPTIMGSEPHFSTMKLSKLTVPIINRTEIKLSVIGCQHVLIGSTFVWKLLTSTVTPEDTHSYSTTSPTAKMIGSVGEQEYRNENKNIKMHEKPFLIYSKIPFVCACPDYIRNNSIIEIKTTEILENAESMFNQLPMRTVCQVWIAMDSAGLNSAQVQLYLITQRKPLVVVKYGYINIQKTIELFNLALTKVAINSYLNYLSKLTNELRFNLELDNTAFFVNSIESRIHKTGKKKLKHQFFDRKLNDCSLINVKCEYSEGIKKITRQSFETKKRDMIFGKTLQDLIVSEVNKNCAKLSDNLETQATITNAIREHEKKCNKIVRSEYKSTKKSANLSSVATKKKKKNRILKTMRNELLISEIERGTLKIENESTSIICSL